MTTKIILDTDIGSDIDDAVCLAYLLAQPDCELLGITTVSGEVVKRAQMASVLCTLAGKDIPIFPGTETPLLVKQKQPLAPQASALTRWGHKTDFPRGEAIEFMRQTIRANPGEVTLLAIGPMTNLALLFKTDPEIPSLLKGLVLMCGVFTNKLAGAGPCEWNSLCDPHASAIVYQSGVAQHRSIGLDVTMQVQMEISQVKERFKAPLLQPVLDFSSVWFEGNRLMTFHDPLAAVTIFEPEVCAFSRGKVEVELLSSRLEGYTYFSPAKTSEENLPHEVALDVNVPLFFERYFKVFE